MDVKETIEGAVDTAKDAAQDAKQAMEDAKAALDTDGNGKLNAQEILGGLGARVDKTVVAAGTFAGEVKQAFDANGDGKVDGDELGAVAKSAANFLGTAARAAVVGVQGAVSIVTEKAKVLVDEARERVEASGAALPDVIEDAAEKAGELKDKAVEAAEDVKVEVVEKVEEIKAEVAEAAAKADDDTKGDAE